MARTYSVEFIDSLLNGEAYQDLAELSSALCSSQQFSPMAPDYGLPEFAFVCVETLRWFAQAQRSGVWTYYEATPLPRQLALAAALRENAATRIAAWYERGMHHWQDEDQISAVDDWIEANDEANNSWLRSFARAHRAAILAMT